jgi:hypothetical protein
MKGHFAYMSGYLICGGCGSSMAPYVPNSPIDNEYTYRVYCTWRECPNYLEVYEPTDKIKVGLIPTKLRAPEPGLATAGQYQAQTTAINTLNTFPTIAGGPVAFEALGGIKVDNPREMTRLTNVEAPPPLLPTNIADWEAMPRLQTHMVTREELAQRYPTGETPPNGGLIRR